MRLSALAIAIVAAGSLGCGDSSVAADASVDVLLACADDCTPYRCDEQRGRCFRDCEDVAQCADGFACNAHECFGTECTTDTAAVCGPYACVDGVCVNNCAVAPC